jgi:stringent starvation protein B
MSFLQQDNPSTRPYLLRALHEWCCDNGFTPYLAVHVDASVQVPMEYVKDGEIVLNVSVDSTSSLRLGNDFVEFKARFGGAVRDIVVPVSHVIAIYARENGQGMAFPAPAAAVLASVPASEEIKALSEWISEEIPDTTEPSSEPRTVLRAVPSEPQPEAAQDGADGDADPPPDGPPRGGGQRPVLKRIK